MKQIFSILLLLITTFTIAQDRKFPPPNESIKDHSLKTFLTNLKRAVQEKDTAFIYAALSTNIKNNFGNNGGINEFKKKWGLEKSNTTFWYYIGRVLSMPGCRSNNNTNEYTTPYVFCMPLKKNDDPFYIVVVTEKNIPLKENPRTSSKTLLTLNYNIISLLPTLSMSNEKEKNEIGEPKWSFVSVKYRKKEFKGWVYYKYIYSPVSYRLILGKENGKWQIQAFVTGD